MMNFNGPPASIPVDHPNDHNWGIILAGGEGRRLQHFLRSEFGHNRPKQYCAILGNQSMLRHTIRRASLVLPTSRLLTVINRHHVSYAMEELRDQPVANIIVQPFSCETGPGILLPLLHVFHRDPDARVAIFPSDHFIVEEVRFMDHVRAAFNFISSYPGLLISLGISPTNVETGYGWIELGELLGHRENARLHRVRAFWEKPDDRLTNKLHAKGCLWNTFTLVGKAALLMSMFRAHMPEIFIPFERVASALGTSREDRIIDEVFASLPSINFSHAVLEKVPRYMGVLPVRDVYWSDWGDEARIRADIARISQHQELTSTWTQIVVS